MTDARVIARASTEIPVAEKFGGGTVAETATVTDYPDAEVVAVEVEHYDGTRLVELDYPTWRAFRAAILANGTVRE